MGVKADGHNFIDLLWSLAQQAAQAHWLTLAVGVSATAFLFWVRKGLKPLLRALGSEARGWPTCWPRPARWRRLPSPPA